jgi:cell division protease FtsH
MLVALIVAFAMQHLLGPKMKELSVRPVELSYSRLLDDVEHGRIKKVKLTGQTAKGQFEPEPKAEQGQGTAGQPSAAGEFFCHVPESDEEFWKIMRSRGVDCQVVQGPLSGFWGTMLMYLLFPLAMVFVLWMLIMKQAQTTGNQALSFGRSRAKRHSDNVPKVTFADVAGVDEAKEELEEIIEFLKEPEKFQALGAKIPKGVLLIGPPGCGKTYLARAIAGEADVPFFHISGSDFVEMFVGVGASRVRDLFEQAKASRPCIVFIDEIDAVGRQRGAGLGGGHDEREQTLNQLLVEMDGFDPNAGIIMIAATNRPDVLDPALLRPGRFDRRIVVDNPDQAGRREILEVHTKGKPLGESVDKDVLARRTPGFTGADIANLVNEAALLAARRDQKAIEMDEFEASIERVIAGPERRSRIISDKEKKILAYHEAGHALVAKLLPNTDPVHKVAIVPRGMALGYTMHLPIEDRYIISRTELLDRIAAMLGGRVAEQMVLEEITTGAQNDLEQATEVARRMVCEFGMTDSLGPLTLGRRQGPIFLGRDLVEERNYSEEVAGEIDKQIRGIIDACYATARTILQEHRGKLDQMVEALLEKETIDACQIDAIVEGISVEEAERRAEEKKSRRAKPVAPIPVPVEPVPEKRQPVPGRAKVESPAPAPA